MLDMMRRKKRPELFMILIGALCASLALAAPEPKTNHVKIGNVDIVSGHFFYGGGGLRLFGGVHLTSPNYDLTADHVNTELAHAGAKNAGPFTVSKVTAEGSATTQVMGVFEQIEQSQKIQVYADRAVYVPETGRVGGGRVDFTGHVKWIIKDTQALAEPSVSRVSHLTVRLGPKPDYPTFEGDDFHANLTHLQ